MALNIKKPGNIVSNMEVVAWPWNAIILPSIYCDKYKADVLENSGSITEKLAFHGHGTI